jgi:hypothetical protein
MAKSRKAWRVVGEFALIVLGVVVALGVDRWVQGVDNSRAERQYLQLVLSDVEANAEIFSRMLQDWESSQEAVSWLLEVVSNGDRPSDSGLLAAVDRGGTINTTPARDASFRDMEATGNIRLLSDPGLRSEIVEYFTWDIRFGRPMIEDRLDLRFRTFSRERISPLLDMRQLCPASLPSSECELENPPSTEALWAELSLNPELKRVLNARLADTFNGTNVVRFWLDQTLQLRHKLQLALSVTEGESV